MQIKDIVGQSYKEKKKSFKIIEIEIIFKFCMAIKNFLHFDINCIHRKFSFH